MVSTQHTGLYKKTAKQPVDTLQQMIGLGQVWSANDCPDESDNILSSGFTELNQYLPGGGWQPGQVCEIYAQPGSAEVSLLLPALATLSQQAKWLLWVAPPAIPYAPTLMSAGVELKQILVVHSQSYEQALWCMEEGLRSGQCSAVLGWPQQWHKQHIRRLQIAAQDSQSFCWLWPQTPFDASGSPAALRLKLQRQRQGLTLEFLKRRGSWPSSPFTLNQDLAHISPAPSL
jgi:hypothetical protein